MSKKFDGISILRSLQNGEFDASIDDEIKKFLRIVQREDSSRTEGSLPRHDQIITRFLFAFNEKFDLLSEDRLASVAAVMADCIKCCRFQKGDDYLYKVSFHLINKFCKLSRLSEAVLLTECIYDEFLFQLENASDEKTSEYILEVGYNLNILLSNLCIRLERQPETALSDKERIVFEGRILSLQFLVFSGRNLSSVNEILSGILSKLSSLPLSYVKSRLDDFVRCCCKELSRSKEKVLAVRSLCVLEIYSSIFQYFVGCNDASGFAGEVLASMKKYLIVEVKPELGKSDKDALQLMMSVLDKILESRDEGGDGEIMMYYLKIFDKVSRLKALGIAAVRIVSETVGTILTVSKCFEHESLLTCSEEDRNAVFAMIEHSFLFSETEFNSMSIEDYETNEKYKKRQLDRLVRLISIKTNKLRTGLLIVQHKSDNSLLDLPKYALSSMSDLKILDNLVYQVAKQQGIAIPNTEKVVIVKICYKWGHHMYTAGQFAGVVDFLTTCIKHYQSFSAEDTKQLLPNFHVLKCYELLASAYRKLDNIKDAQKWLLDGLVADGSRDCIASSVKQWVKIQICLAEADTANTCKDPLMIRTLSSALKDCKSDQGQAFDNVAILQEELKMAILLKVGACTYCQKIFDELDAKLDHNPVLRASVLIDRALYALSQKTDVACSAKLLCQEAIKLLEAVQEHNATSKDLLSRANICMFAINEPDQIDKLMHSSQEDCQLSNQASTGADDEEDEEDKENSDAFPEYRRTFLYSDHLRPLTVALELWETCFADGETTKISCKEILDIARTVEFLQTTSVIFKLMQDAVQLGRALRLLLRVADELDDRCCRLWTSRQQIELCLMLRHPVAAEQIIHQVDAWNTENDSSLQEFTRLRIEYLVSKIDTYISLGKVKEIEATLSEAKELKGKFCRGRTKDSLIVSGLLSFVESKAVGVKTPEQFLSSSKGNSDQSTGTQLENAVCGMRSFLATLYFLFRDTNLPGSKLLIERWMVLELMVMSLLHTGRSYLRSGVRREAMFYLSQGLRFCQAFCLRKRFCEFHLELARLNLLSDKFDESSAHVHRVVSILGDEGKKRSSRTLAFLSPKTEMADSPSDDADNFLKTKPHKLNKRSVKEKNLGSSPVSKSAGSMIPQSWEHEVSCDCAECTDLPLQMLWMSSIIVDLNSAMRQRRPDCVKLAQHVLKKQEKLGKQAEYVREKFQPARPTESKTKDKKTAAKRASAKTSSKCDLSFNIFKPEFLKIHLMMAENAAYELDASTFGAHLDSARRLFDCSSFYIDDKVDFLAQLLYLSFVASFSWPSTDEIAAMSEIQWICYSIGQRKVEEDISAGKIVAKTPKSRRNRGTRRTCASPTNTSDDLPSSCAVPRAPTKKNPIDQPIVLQAAAPSKRKPRQITWKPEVEVLEISSRSQIDETKVSQLISKLSLDDENELTQKAGSRQVEAGCDETASIKTLHEAFHMLCHDPPTFLYRQVCHLLAVHHLKEREPLAAAFYFAEAQAVAFRHYCQMTAWRKLSKITSISSEESSSDGCSVAQASTSCNQLIDLKDAMMFGKNEDEFQKSLDSLEEGWTVCQLSVVRVAGHDPGRLYATRFERGASPLTVCLSGFSSEAGQKLLAEFELIMNENQNSMLVSDRAEWWKLRDSIDKRLQELLVNLESQWLGCWRGVILGSLSFAEDRKKLKSAVAKFLKQVGIASTKKELVECLLSAAHLMSDREIAHALQVINDGERDIDVLRKQMNIVQNLSKDMNLCICSRGVTMLILDKEIQHLPWESVPCLESLKVTRFPSAHFLFAQLRCLTSDPLSILNFGIDKRSTFYLLNPDKTLNETQKAFEEWFQSLQGWTGVVARPPTNEELTTALVNKDLYVYCGHGAGKRYIPTDFLLSLNCRAAALLMGCSSGHLVTCGEFEAWGTLLMFCLAGIPCVLANLWDVTDRDIDRYLESLLKTWLDRESTGSIVDTRQSSRLACRFKHLIGAAPVIYGFPVQLKRNN